jgi:hypothetical protein
MCNTRLKALVISGIIFCLFSNIWAYSGGDGSAENPYQIATKADLLQLAATTADYNKCFIFTDDIDMAGQVFTTAIIAADTSSSSGFQGTAFTGTFNGDGHVISNLNIDANEKDYIGLFGYFYGGSVENLGLEDFSVNGRYYAGGLVGYSYYGSISNCYSTGIVIGSFDVGGFQYVGGLVGGNSYGSIANCYATSAVSGSQNVGGLAGENSRGNINNCYSTGTVSGEDKVGGLVGYNYGSINNCYSTGGVNGSQNVGGLAGENGGNIGNCYATGTVSGGGSVGGLVGNNYLSSISNCYSTGTVNASSSYAGGLVGCNTSSINNCYSTSTVSGYYDAGGLVGENGGSISNCYSTGAVSGYSGVGGLAGSNWGAITGSFWDIETSGRTTSHGGEGKTTAQMQDINTFLNAGWDFLGESASGTGEAWQMPTGGGYPVLSIFNGYIPPEPAGSGTENDPYIITDANDLVTIYYRPMAHYRLSNDIDLSQITWSMSVVPAFYGSFDGAGYTIANMQISGGGWLGLFGYLGPGSQISNLCLESISVSGATDRVGGLVGENRGSINNCYATGEVNGDGYVGGLVGLNTYGGNINNCYSTGTVSGSGYYVGGLAGRNYSGSISNCYSAGAVNNKNYVGGLVGENYSGSISNCYSTGMVSSGYNNIGGLVGRNSGVISNCYATGKVNGNRYIGGLVGGNYGNGSISNCYSTGTVSGSSNIGGLVGYSSSGGATNSFWDIETSGQTSSAGGIGRTTAQMQDINTFLNAGWDFFGETANGTDDIWTICDEFTYPKFVYQNAKPIADAGSDQTIYLYIDEDTAEVELDGSASSDIDECNGLSYHWTWTIDANTYEEANGVNPIIDLPVGVHTIELIVNDGLADSEPNYVDVNVIAPLKTNLSIMPCVVNRASRLRNIIAVMEMPKDIKRGDVSKEPFVLFLADGEEGIEAVRQYVLPCWRHRVRVFAFFDKDDLIDLIPDNGRIELQVIGELNSGQYVFGEDSIRIIGKHPFRWRWRKW